MLSIRKSSTHLLFRNDVLLMLVGTFLVSATYWMTWPFLAVILNQKYNLSASSVGAMLSVSVLASTFAGVYFGNLSDRFGRAKLMIAGSILSAVAFTIMALAFNLYCYLIAIAFVSLSRAVLDPLSKAIFGDVIADFGDRASALHLRYFIVNVGAACGPLIGVYFGLAAQQVTFFIAAASYVGYLFLLYPVFSCINRGPTSQVSHDVSFSQIIKLLVLDKGFMILVIINILLWIVFVQFESTLVLYFSLLKLPMLTKMAGILILVHTITIISLQFPLLSIMKNLNVAHRIYIGIGLLGVSQLIFAFFSPERAACWILGTFIFSIAEAILVPNLNVMIDRMAPNHLRGSYFAASFLYRIGFGAYIGGVLLQYSGGRGLFASMFFVCLIIASLYSYSTWHVAYAKST